MTEPTRRIPVPFVADRVIIDEVATKDTITITHKDQHYYIEYIPYFPPPNRWQITKRVAYPSILGPITWLLPAFKNHPDFPDNGKFKTKREALNAMHIWMAKNP